MSYTKHTWQSGDVITAEKLNHIEDGVDLGVSLSTEIAIFTITVSGSTFTITDGTFADIVDAYNNRKLVALKNFTQKAPSAGDWNFAFLHRVMTDLEDNPSLFDFRSVFINPYQGDDTSVYIGIITYTVQENSNTIDRQQIYA